MRKLKLDIDSLHVESFVAGTDGGGQGTVRAAMTPINTVPATDPNDTLDEYCTQSYDPWDFTPACLPSVNIPDTCVAPCQ